MKLGIGGQQKEMNNNINLELNKIECKSLLKAIESTREGEYYSLVDKNIRDSYDRIEKQILDKASIKWRQIHK